MMKRLALLRHALGAAAIVQMAGSLTFMSASPAAAAFTPRALPFKTASECRAANGGNLVTSLSINSGNVLTLYASTATDRYSGVGHIEVTCYDTAGAEIGYVRGASVEVSITDRSTNPPLTLADFVVWGPGSSVATNPNTFMFDGYLEFNVHSDVDNLASAQQPIADNKEVLVKVAGATFLENNAIVSYQIYDSAGVRAAIGIAPRSVDTPELGSLALFGSGALSAAGYAMTRLRARRRD